MHNKLDALSVETSASDLTLGGLSLDELAPEPVSYPLVSFIIRNWNYARFVGSAIRSVRNQTYPNFEAIVVDNGSTDGSRAEIEAAIADDPRFRTIWLDENLGALAGALKGLDVARGAFVTFVDSDDYLLADFAAMHVQAHLALPRGVAFTSSAVIEIDAAGAVLGSGLRGLQLETRNGGLRSPFLVLRLSEVSRAQFDQLDRSIVAHPPTENGWLWSPGTSNMFRRFLIETIRPRAKPDVMFGLSADGHFCRLAHVLSGSATIAMPLSAYRLHGDNFFAGNPALDGVVDVSGPARKFFPARRREAMRVLVEDATSFSASMGAWRFWSAIAQILDSNGASSVQVFEAPEAQAIIAENLALLFTAFGKWSTLRKLRELMSRRALQAILRAADQGPVAYAPRMVGIEISMFEARLRRKRRAKAARRKQRT
ncbi:glycosyltransferase involved in cell wall biosynthesis [Aminobacter lissarensis]|uniref:Glycosyltransferase involved in cell wall biosynthesis n=1 Tax=Aminobacter carboxidus TaxID=376165 RepID=A0A8E2BBH3_9HYPH|nr:glycosyltransferase family A protein [Aminobacter lissarensis]MBB6465833.1 glycosyltransferase involved in cell wall biosynthesis [Aminobacter lissarensis]